MKIAAIIKGCGQVGENQFQDYQKIYVFDSAVSIDYILQVTKQTDICACNLSMVEEDLARIIGRKKMKPKYSGDKSQKFWDKVNSLKNRHGELYSLGVCLQNLEGFVLKQLEIALIEQGAENTDVDDLALHKKEQDDAEH